ncbi:DNA repair protein RecO [Larsenimonas rhizosphaerae]|uniref:DNA repair protein RecO n=1 Tax=Larsenimonas rhizosphaerae TaxID=2944682 RepID=A0AA41ZGA8_9GAMM|nr:DNA repair protein RecO [Larsenimonas rhizosphaerae]MCM2130929.1 DNA repair protein RecO [Larsenimonas rhizosphaerae]MCX2523634.1 DNA repair protein RecO [Larsenimonas rhizosphaerae]
MQLQPAYLLHRRPYRETSALVELLTMEYGRVRAVARGVMRPGSKARHRLQPFSPLHITWAGHGDLKTLRVFESSGQGAMLAGEGLLCGLYANEVLARCLPLEGAVPDVFGAYAVLLGALPFPDRRQSGLRRFEQAVLSALDADPVFADGAGSPLDPHSHYLYVKEARHFQVVPMGQGVDGRSLRAMAQGDWGEPANARVAKYLARQALAPLLGDRPLRSRELIQQLGDKRRRAAVPPMSH